MNKKGVGGYLSNNRNMSKGLDCKSPRGCADTQCTLMMIIIIITITILIIIIIITIIITIIIRLFVGSLYEIIFKVYLFTPTLTTTADLPPL